MSVAYTLTVSYRGALVDIVDLYQFASGGDQSPVKATLQAGGGEAPQVHVYIDGSGPEPLEAALARLGEVHQKALDLGLC